jgi:hypothetical protein
MTGLTKQQAEKMKNTPARMSVRISSIKPGYTDGTFIIKISDSVTVKVVKEP